LTNAPALRVGVAPVSLLMIYMEGAKIVGVEADFAQALGKELGRNHFSNQTYQPNNKHNKS
jgi:ABC-type amino acid transport substrate-binding protein